MAEDRIKKKHNRSIDPDERDERRRRKDRDKQRKQKRRDKTQRETEDE